MVVREAGSFLSGLFRSERGCCRRPSRSGATALCVRCSCV